MTFTSMKKDPVEDVFLTHLEMEFPEFRQISASIRGELSTRVHYFSNVFFDICVRMCFACVCAHLPSCICTQPSLTTSLSLIQRNQGRAQGRYAELLSR